MPTVFLSEGQGERGHLTHDTQHGTEGNQAQGRTQTRVPSPVSRNWRSHWTLHAPFYVEGCTHAAVPRKQSQRFHKHGTYWSTAQPRLSALLTLGGGRQQVFSSGLSCSMVSTTGNSRARSLPGFSKMNCSSTFFRYSRLAADFSRSWFRSSRLTSLFRSWCQRSERRKGFFMKDEHVSPSFQQPLKMTTKVNAGRTS